LRWFVPVLAENDRLGWDKAMSSARSKDVANRKQQGSTSSLDAVKTVKK